MKLRHVFLGGLLLAAAPALAQSGPAAQPASADWTRYGGTYDSQRHSPLTQINTTNVQRMQVKWVYHVTGSDELEMTPVVKDGIMYIAQYNRVDAIDARTGNVICLSG